MILYKILFINLINIILCESDIPIVDVKECSAVYKYKDMHFMGCTDMDSEGQPWCLLKTPKDKQTWAYCDMNTINTNIGDDNGVKKDCDVSSKINDKYAVYGCYSKDSKTYQCKSSNKEINCLIKLSDKDYKRPNTNTTSPVINKNPNNNNRPDTKSIEKVDEDSSPIQMILILSILGGIGFISAIVLFFLAKKRKNKATQQLQQKQNLSKSSSISTLINNNNNINNLSQLNDQSNLLKQLLVISTYKPTLSDELIIKPGDKVVVYKEYDDGWVQGANLTRGGVKGVFPKHCIEPLSDSQLQNSKMMQTNKRSSSNIFNNLPKSAI